MRSEDDGQSWSLVGLAKPAPLVTALVLSPNFDADGVAVAGTAEDGVFVTDDGGLTWVPWNYGLIDLDVHAVAISPNFSADQTIFAATENRTVSQCQRGAFMAAVDIADRASALVSVGLL